MPKLSDEWKEWTVFDGRGEEIGKTKKLPFSPVVGGYVFAVIDPLTSRKIRVDEVDVNSLTVKGTIIDRKV